MILQNIGLIGLAICGLGFLILIHEFGHFIVAKIFGIKVEAFSIGFGPALFKYKMGETEYRLSLFFLLGGYVKLYGETSKEQEQIQGDADRAMVNRPLWQQVSVVFAGVFMNFVIGIIFCIIAFSYGINMSAPVIGNISSESVEANTPLSIGDTILTVGGKTVRSLEEFRLFLVTEKKPLTVKAKNSKGEIFEFIVNDQKIGGKISASALPVYILPTIEEMDSNSLMAKWGFKKGDAITDVNGSKIFTWQEFLNYLNANYGKEITVNLIRENNDMRNIKFKVDVPQYIFGLDSRKFLSTKICGIKKYSLAEDIGIKKSEKILSLNGKKLNNWYELNNTLWEERQKENLTLEIEDEYNNKRVITAKNRYFIHGKPFLGISACEEDIDSNIFTVLPESFINSGIKPLSKLIEINGKPAKSIKEIFAIGGEKEELISLKIQSPDAGIKELKIATEKIPIIPEGILGVTPKVKTVTISYPFFEAIGKGTLQAFEFIRMTYLSIVLLIKREVSTKDLAGPVGIVDVARKVAQKSFIHFLYLMALISLNLAILNILPIPILDGSLIVLYTLEKILKRRLPEKLLRAFEITGLGLLLFILLFALKNDIFRLIK